MYISVLNEQFKNIKAYDITTATKMMFLENYMKQDGEIKDHPQVECAKTINGNLSTIHT